MQRIAEMNGRLLIWRTSDERILQEVIGLVQILLVDES